MTLLAPLLAALTALGAIPVIIWLLNRNKFKVVEWPAIEFLLKTLQRSSRRLQLRELLLLILRTLAVVLMALALSRPTVAGGAIDLLGLHGGVSAVIILDNSLSMAARDGNESRFELAKQRATELVGHLPGGSTAALILMSDVAVAELAEPSQDLAWVAQTLAAANQGDGGTSIAAGLAKAWDILKPIKHGRKEIYLVTDLQARAWPSADDASWKSLVDGLAQQQDVSLFIADVADGRAIANVAVTRFSADDDLVTSDSPISFTARLENHGGAPVTDLPVELYVDDAKGELRKAATTVVERLETTREIQFEARIPEPGLHRVQVRLGADHLANDNQQQTVIDVVARIRVLVVDGADGERGGGSEFLRAALAPRRGDDQDQSGLFIVDVVGAKAVSTQKLDDYQVVVLNDVAEPTPAFAAALRSWVANGHGLVLMPGARAKPAAWNQALAALLPATLAPEARELKDEQAVVGKGGTKVEQGICLATTELFHPVVAFFAAPEIQPFLAQPRFRKAHLLTPAAGTSLVLRFADGSPALTERLLGRGSVMLSAFPTDKAWSDLPLRPAFLMLMRRLAQQVALGNRPRLSLRTHDPIALTLPSRKADARVSITDPRGATTTLNPGDGPDGTATVTYGETGSAGFYRLAVAARSTGSSADPPWFFAVNPPGAESELEPMQRAQVEERLMPLAPLWIGATDDARARVDRSRSGIEIWPLLFALAVACLIAESWLVVRWTAKSALGKGTAS